MVDPIASAMDPYVRRATATMFTPRTQQVIVRLIVALFAITAMIGAAVVAYAGFYYFYVPKIAHSAPVYLDYRFVIILWIVGYWISGNEGC